MTIPVHYLQVFEKPKISGAFLKRYPIAGYKHRIIANGGFDTASCVLPVSRAEGEAIYEQYVGNRVTVIVDNPIEPIFEGLISRVTFTLPGLVLTRSLDAMGNRARVTAAVGANGNTGNITSVNNTESQAIYGVKEKILRAARQSTGGGGTYTTSLANRALNDFAYPLTSVASADGGVNAIIAVEMKGFYHTLDWENCNTVSVGVQGFGTWMVNILGAIANGTTFIDNTDLTGITPNGQTYNLGTQVGSTAWKQMQMLTECGANAQRWVVGVAPTNPTTRTRRLYYRPAVTTVKYLAKVNKPGQLFTPQNVRVRPWTVQPDGVVKIVDALVGWDGGGSDPRQAYIASVQYDADSGKVSWQSDDNIQLAGALEVDRWHTASDQLYGQRASNPLM